MSEISVYGFHPFREAVLSGKKINKLFIKNGLKSRIYNKIMYLIKNFNIPFKYVTLQKLNRLTHNNNHQGIFAVLSPIELYKIENIVPIIYEKKKNPLILILDRIKDTRNLGSIIRTASCADVHSIIIPSKNSASINSNTVKTSSGGIFKIPICKEKNLKKTLIYLKNYGIQIIAVTEKSKEIYTNFNFSLPTAFIFGSEENGINSTFLSLCNQSVKIPILNKGISSLNVSIACGIILYETQRQRFLFKKKN